jgi:dTMP kinase
MRNHGLPGKFIVLDGGEAVGKGTQIAELKRAFPLRYPDREFVFVHEPGGTPYADELYARFKKGMKTDSPRKQFGLVVRSRFDHVEEVILPALERGGVVVSDRFEGSTFAYQVFTPPADELLAPFHHHQQLVPAPDLTLILEVPIEIAVMRIAARIGQEASAFDLAKREFHERVAEGFHWYAKFHAGHKVVFVDGHRHPAEVREDLLRHIAAVLS